MRTRRDFLKSAAAVTVLSHLPAFAQEAGTVTLTVNPAQRGVTMPASFTGLSFESAQLGHPEFFSGKNTQLIALFRRLGASGVLRIGGNTSDYTRWSGDDAAAAANQTPAAIGPDKGTAALTASVITPQAIRSLNDFMGATGWRLIYGLNLWHGTTENAAAEAKFVADTLGSRLLAFQIGNEPDLFHDAGSKERWTFDRYWAKWQAFHDAVRQATPAARFAGPDIAKYLDWITLTAQQKPDIDFLSGHHYAEGPPADPKMTLEYLLHRGNDPSKDEIPIVQTATKMCGKGYRMSEGNTCFHGGKPGVSDTFASALWSGDYMLQLAQAGYLGVNLHGGGEGLYTPIAGGLDTGYTARPVYYGMLLAERFAGCTFVDVSLSEQRANENVTAFAAVDGKQMKIAIFNKGGAPVTMKIAGLTESSKAAVMMLQASAIDAKNGVTLGGATVASDGSFEPKTQSQVKLHHGSGTITIPAYTGALLEA